MVDVTRGGSVGLFYRMGTYPSYSYQCAHPIEGKGGRGKREGGRGKGEGGRGLFL